ncbi:alpha/beta fold hydrolase [Actinokineospora iranica]|uniref:Pimeloyl-ACP methyl ester carboxylesterase n=1 Tax=Actinokineospora iranica TaxID=1271860 RepID=A0A1G6Z918_9PSEU|nr:alpha/beta fold hydrolase [Actinokineospora iranica]SDD99138.1 Pimeloyl-ACP methyl ester carboxylesterase [Actinokineospora iranica]
MGISAREATLHGRRVGFLHYTPADPGADTDPVVLLHGLAGTNATWKPFLAEVERRGADREVIAIDLPGHGRSEPPNGDYSIGSYANTVRDLVVLLGHKHTTLVGHSLGGGVALQFSYQFPHMCGRLVLVDSGGLGPEVTAAIRAANLPGTSLALPLIVNRATVSVARTLAGLSGHKRVEALEVVAHFATLADRAARESFVRTVRASVGLLRQRASASDRLYLAEEVPSLLVWGSRDRIIPVKHGHQAAELIPGARLAVLDGVGHFPHVARPDWFADVLWDFLDTTKGARIDIERLAERLTVA